ncbi:unnamed protein product [Ectocarpus sp. 6 AP-2014]
MRYDDLRVEVWDRSALRKPILNGSVVVVGSRSKSSSLMFSCGMAGISPVDVVEQSGLGLSVTGSIVDIHPNLIYRILSSALFFCPDRHHLPDSDTTTRKSGASWGGGWARSWRVARCFWRIPCPPIFAKMVC